MSKALYLGPGKDLFTYLNFSHIKTFISIEGNNNEGEKNIVEWLNELVELFQKVDFELIKANKNMMKFQKENQIVEYYYNIKYEDLFSLQISKSLENKIRGSSIFVLINQIPNQKILELFQPKISIICSTNTCYLKSLVEKEEEVKELLKDRVKEYYLLFLNKKLENEKGEVKEKNIDNERLEILKCYDLDRLVSLCFKIKE